MTLDSFLNRYEGKQVFYKPNMGNGGDALIAAGAFKYFEKHNIEVNIITNLNSFDLNDKVVFYPGGGNLIDDYKNGAEFFHKYHQTAKEIILMPHTVNGHINLLKSFGENITLFAREKMTANFLEQLNLKCKLYIDHDLAFILDPYDFRNLSTDKPLELKRQVHKKKLKTLKLNFKELNAFRNDVERTDIVLPKDNMDVSNLINYRCQMDNVDLIKKSVADIFQFINKFNTINTNRLHIAIAGALLKKKVNLYPNSYWKNEAMYEYSLKEQFTNVRFVK